MRVGRLQKNSYFSFNVGGLICLRFIYLFLDKWDTENPQAFTGCSD